MGRSVSSYGNGTDPEHRVVPCGFAGVEPKHLGAPGSGEIFKFRRFFAHLATQQKPAASTECRTADPTVENKKGEGPQRI